MLPEARVVYVGHDPMVAAYSGPLLANVAERVHLRSKAEVERFFDGLEMVPPYTGADGVTTYAGLSGAEDIEAADTEGSRGIYCGVARRP